MHYHSDTRPPQGPTYLVAAVAVALALIAPMATFIGALVTTDRYIVPEGIVIEEDQFVAAVQTIVEGTIDGDLTVFSGDLDITGTVTGSVTMFSSGAVTVHDGGVVGGTVKGASVSTTIAGTVERDVFAASGSVVVEETGRVGRDVFGFAGTMRIEGEVARDVRGRVVRSTFDGSVGGDVDIATVSMSIGPTAVIGGDIVYRSAADASISSDATIGGTVTRLPAVGNFIYSIVLSLANLVGFLGFVVAGLLALWILRGTGARAVGAVMTRPVATLFAGIGTVVVLPLLIGLTAVTLVGIPLSIVLIMLAVTLFVVGAVPAVATLGHFVLWRRGGLFGAFLIGAILWRLAIWIIPYAGAGIFVLGLVWGIGGWVTGAIATRRADPIVPALLPPSIVTADDEVPEGWEPPLAPIPPENEEIEETPDAIPDGEADAEPADDVEEPQDQPAAAPLGEDEPISFGASSAPAPRPAASEEKTPEEEMSLADRFAALKQELTGAAADGDQDPDGADEDEES